MPLVPRLLLLTDRCRLDDGSLVDLIGSVGPVDGAAWMFREKDMDPEARRSLAEQVSAACRDVEVPLIVASDVALAVTLGAAGVHLAAADPSPSCVSGFDGFDGLVGRSCHTTAEVGRSVADRFDYVTLSPVFVTASKPGYGPALGLAGLTGAAEAHAIPILALGGIDLGSAANCVAAGAAGVAVMGALSSADDPRRLVAGLASEVVVR